MNAPHRPQAPHGSSEPYRPPEPRERVAPPGATGREPLARSAAASDALARPAAGPAGSPSAAGDARPPSAPGDPRPPSAAGDALSRPAALEAGHGHPPHVAGGLPGAPASHNPGHVPPGEPHVQAQLRHVARTFLTGLLAALPLLATVLVVGWVLRLAWLWLGPDSFIGSVLAAIGLGLTGSRYVGYLIGVLLLALGIFALGMLVEARLERGLARLVNTLVSRIPLVRNIYEMARKFVDLFSQREQDGLKSMSPVWCHFGGPGGVAVLGLLSTPQPIVLGDKAFHAVLVPTAPVPVGGGLLYVPQEWVTPAEVGMDGLTSIYVSMGVTSGQHLKVVGREG